MGFRQLRRCLHWPVVNAWDAVQEEIGAKQQAVQPQARQVVFPPWRLGWKAFMAHSWTAQAAACSSSEYGIEQPDGSKHPRCSGNQGSQRHRPERDVAKNETAASQAFPVSIITDPR